MMQGISESLWQAHFFIIQTMIFVDYVFVLTSDIEIMT